MNVGYRAHHKVQSSKFKVQSKRMDILQYTFFQNALIGAFLASILCGVFCAFGGMYLSMGAMHSFTAGMVSGRGFMSLAMDAIAQGNPLIGCASSFLYGFSDTITVYLQLYSKLDLKLISAFPYVFILVVLMIIQACRKMIENRKQRNLG